MATQSENADIRELQTDMRNVKDTVLRIENKIDRTNNSYAPKDGFDNLVKDVILLKEDTDKVKGGILLLKGITTFLTLVGIILGALWWLRA